MNRYVLFMVIFFSDVTGSEGVNFLTLTNSSSQHGNKTLSIARDGDFNYVELSKQGNVVVQKRGALDPAIIEMLDISLESIGYFSINQLELEAREAAVANSQEIVIDGLTSKISIFHHGSHHVFSGQSLSSIADRRISHEYKIVQQAWRYILVVANLAYDRPSIKKNE